MITRIAPPDGHAIVRFAEEDLRDASPIRARKPAKEIEPDRTLMWWETFGIDGSQWKNRKPLAPDVAALIPRGMDPGSDLGSSPSKTALTGPDDQIVDASVLIVSTDPAGRLDGIPAPAAPQVDQVTTSPDPDQKAGDAAANLVGVSDPEKSVKSMHARKRMRRGRPRSLHPGIEPSPALAKEFARFARIGPNDTVFHPAVGDGTILKAMLDTGVQPSQIAIMDWDSKQLAKHEGFGGEKMLEDFLFTPKREFDRVVINPSFERHLELKFLFKAFNHHVKEGGTVAILVSNQWRTNHDRLSKAMRSLVNLATQEKRVRSQVIPAGTYPCKRGEAGLMLAITVPTPDEESQKPPKGYWLR